MPLESGKQAGYFFVSLFFTIKFTMSELSATLKTKELGQLLSIWQEDATGSFRC